jgi:hypothetical protein
VVTAHEPLWVFRRVDVRAIAEQSDKLSRWIGRELFDANAQKIGTITGPGFPRRKFGTMWLLVETTGLDKIPVPLIGIRSSGDRLVLPYPKSYVESGPTIVQDRPLSRAELRRLGLHYGFDHELPGATCCQSCGLCRAGRRAERSQ